MSLDAQPVKDKLAVEEFKSRRSPSACCSTTTFVGSRVHYCTDQIEAAPNASRDTPAPCAVRGLYDPFIAELSDESGRRDYFFRPKSKILMEDAERLLHQ